MSVAAAGAGAAAAGAPPPLADRLTVVIVTSPVVSHPATALVELLLRSFQLVPGLHPDSGSDGGRPPMLVVCDGCPAVKPDDGINPKYRRRKFVTRDEADNYSAFQQRLRARLPPRARVLALPHRLGFALALKEAVVHHVRTPFVMVVQHDWAFVRPFPLRTVLDAMTRHPALKYVGLPSSSQLNYVETCHTRTGIRVESQAARFGGLPLLPLLFWYDKTHIACVEHYRRFVFRDAGSPEARTAAAAAAQAAGERAAFRPGDFIEDTLGQRQLEDVKRNGMSAHAKYGTFLLDDGGGAVLAHLHGRRFLTADQREAQGMPRERGSDGVRQVEAAVAAWEGTVPQLCMGLLAEKSCSVSHG
jgi:hypothetical protein